VSIIPISNKMVISNPEIFHKIDLNFNPKKPRIEVTSRATKEFPARCLIVQRRIHIEIEALI
jgi:hypothetical protein